MPSQTPIDDIYDFSGELKYYLRRIDSSERVDPPTKEKIKEFLGHVAATGAGEGRQAKYVRHLLEICERLGKPIVDANRQDIEKLMVSFREGYVVSHPGPTKGQRRHYSPWTISDFVMVTKRFMKFVRCGNTDRETPFPEEVRWLKKTIKANEMKKPEFLTPPEVEAMIKVADLPRDKAMLSVGFEGGLRASELLLLNVGDLSFDTIGARIRVRGKTGERIVRLIASVPFLARYMENYRHRDRPEKPLWAGEARNRPDQRVGVTRWNELLRSTTQEVDGRKKIHDMMVKMKASGLSYAEVSRKLKSLGCEHVQPRTVQKHVLGECNCYPEQHSP